MGWSHQRVTSGAGEGEKERCQLPSDESLISGCFGSGGRYLSLESKTLIAWCAMKKQIQMIRTDCQDLVLCVLLCICFLLSQPPQILRISCSGLPLENSISLVVQLDHLAYSSKLLSSCLLCMSTCPLVCTDCCLSSFLVHHMLNVFPSLPAIAQT